ncbi:MAG: nucleotidyltransferase domain-containing protein [bacterium]
MDKSEVIEKLRNYSKRINEISNPELIYLFGSYAKGNWHKDSDIDVAVIFDKLNVDRYDIMKKILRIRRDIDLKIEPIIFEKGVDPSGFLQTIIDTAELIYKRD